VVLAYGTVFIEDCMTPVFFGPKTIVMHKPKKTKNKELLKLFKLIDNEWQE
jgi:hypothetical protein